MMRRIHVVTAALALALAPQLQAASVPFGPSKDNTLIQQVSPTGQLSNGLGDIFVGRTNQDGQGPATISIRRGLIEFDLAAASTINGQSIPAGATITGVTLTMRDVMGLNGDHAATLYRVSKEWGEGTSFQNGGMGAAATNGDATWIYTEYNAATPASSPAWTTPGGDYAASASGSAIISDDLGAGQTFTWSSASNPQMIADVQSWLASPADNHGWILIGNEAAGQTAKRLNSSESMTAPNQPPVLTVTFLVPEPASLGFVILPMLLLACRRTRRR